MMKTKKNFQILQTNTNKYKFLILSTSYVSITDQLLNLENELHDMKFQGDVIIDFLLSNGSYKNRFFEAFFDGKRLLKRNSVALNVIDKSINKLSLKFYHDNYNSLIKDSILSRPVKHLIKMSLQ